MAQKGPRKPISFVVRFYREITPDPKGWRGQAEHVQSRGKRPFHSAAELLRVIEDLATEVRSTDLTHDR